VAIALDRGSDRSKNCVRVATETNDTAFPNRRDPATGCLQPVAQPDVMGGIALLRPDFVELTAAHDSFSCDTVRTSADFGDLEHPST
jgi:hypothetical protein